MFPALLALIFFQYFPHCEIPLNIIKTEQIAKVLLVVPMGVTWSESGIQ